MPRRAGTGPMGNGPITGRGFGVYTGANAVNYASGIGMRLGLNLACRHGFERGFGRYYVINQTSAKTQKELLQEQKTLYKIVSKSLTSSLKTCS